MIQDLPSDPATLGIRPLVLDNCSQCNGCAIAFHDTAHGSFFWNIEGAPVPADAGLRITTPEWLVAMTLLLFIANDRQLNRPVVRQIQGVPFGIVELHRGKFKFTALGEVSLALTEAKIVQRVGAIALEKFPIKVEQQTFAGCNRTGSFRRGDTGILRQHCLGALYGSAHQSRGG